MLSLPCLVEFDEWCQKNKEIYLITVKKAMIHLLQFGMSVPSLHWTQWVAWQFSNVDTVKLMLDSAVLTIT